MNQYENSILANTIIMRIFFIVIALVNGLLPYTKDFTWNFSIFQLIIIVAWFFNLLGGLGYFNQATFILPVGITRIIQILVYLLLKFRKINWWIIGVYVFLDIIYLVFLLFDKANYTYITVEDNDNGNS